MNPLKSQKLKRARRQALHEARHANKTTPPATENPSDVVIYATREGNVYRRKFMKKRGVLRENIAVTWRDAIAKVPSSWKGSCIIDLPAGTYGYGIK